MIESISKEKCTGCKMCADVCPVDAIEYKTDEQGFWYPDVNYDKCIQCNKCLKVCPSLNMKQVTRGNQPKVYAVWSKDDENRITSTSGGVFYEIALQFIKRGGVVAGCAYSDDWKSAYHMLAHNEEELKKIKGSKYFQSNTEGIYKEIKKALEEEKKVLFCGTPCQNAALQMYLGKKAEKVYYMDFICRSINSPKAFKAYLDELENKYKSKITEVHLKDKTRGWQSLASKVSFANGKYSLEDKNTDWWVRGFIYNDLYTRESCYHCKYKVLPRIGADVTIGDFWGIKNQTTNDMFKGISVVLINNERGKEIFDMSSDAFEIQEKNIEDVLPGNKALLQNPEKTAKQKKFFKLLTKKPFSYCVKKCIKSSKIKKIYRRIRRNGGKIYRFLKNDNQISRLKFLFYNYMCKNVVREGKGKIIPYKNAIINLDKTAKIYIKGGDLEIGINKLTGSKAETHVRIEKNAVWEAKGGCNLFYNTVFEIKPNAKFVNGFFSANGGSVIIVEKKMTFGEDVMIGRNVIVYDSDFHKIKDKDGKCINQPKEVIIEDHVWLTSNICVLKGVTIGKDSLVTAQTLIRKDIPPKSIVSGGASGKVIGEASEWSRERIL